MSSGLDLMADSDDEGGSGGAEELPEYERERLANIKRNQEVLRQLGLFQDPPPSTAASPASPASCFWGAAPTVQPTPRPAETSVRRRWTHVDHLPLAELYRWLGEQHARGENTNLYDPAIKRLLKSYKLPFKNITVPGCGWLMVKTLNSFRPLYDT